MKILLKRTINRYMQLYPDASHALFNWNHEFALHKFANFNEIKAAVSYTHLTLPTICSV